jgi:hypothetical protein
MAVWTWRDKSDVPVAERASEVNAYKNSGGVREQRIFKMPPSPDRAKLRSKTYTGIARAMAEQWAGPDVIHQMSIDDMKED